jgi:hypothetical protein
MDERLVILHLLIPRLGQSAQDTRQSKIRYPRIPISTHKHISGLEITVHEPRYLSHSMLHPPSYVKGKKQRLFNCYWLARKKPTTQRSIGFALGCGDEFKNEIDL